MRDCDSLILESLYLELLLEKDHRQKIKAMGIPDDVADYLHNFNNKYSIWFADKIKDMNGFQWSSGKINWINVNILTQMQGIMDWIRNVPNVNLKQYTWDQAVEAQEEYHEKLEAATLEGQEDNTIIKKYNDGLYWVDLEGTRDCSESELMGHCGTTWKADTMYSLRKYTPETQTIEAFISIAISPDDGTWYQCKGKKNSKPKEVYHPYIADILIEKKVFSFRVEHNPHNDFTDKDLAEYVRDHSNEIANADDILEKIEEGNISYKDFEKVLKEYQGDMDTFSLDIDSDSDGENEYIYVNGYFQVVIKFSEIDIPNIKEIINEHGGEISYYKNRENLDGLLDKFDVYPSDGGEVRIEETNEGDSFYVATYLDLSDDNYYSLNDQGVESFRSLCQSYVRSSTNFDKEEFIERFKIFALLEGWWSNEFSEFTDKVEEEEYKNVVERTTDKNFDFTIKYRPFENLLKEYRNYDNVSEQLSKIEYLKHRDLNDDEINLYPYAQYLLDYFKYAFNQYLKVPEFSVKGKDDWTISIQDTLRYEDRKDYNLEKDLGDFKKIDEAYETIKNGYYKLCNNIIIPMFKSSRSMTFNDIYWKEEELKELLQKIKEDHYAYLSHYLPIYDRETNMKITTISLSRLEKEKSIEENIKDRIDVDLENRYRKYPRYNKELIQNFLKEVFPKQLTFKDYLAQK